MIEILNPMVTVFLISLLISFALSMVYKIFTNQKELKGMNEELKEMNSKFKEAQKNKDQKELMKLQGKMLEINSKKMKNTMKPMMISFLIIIPVFVYVFPTLYGDLVVELDDSMEGVMEFGGIEKSLQVSGEDVLVEGRKIEGTLAMGDSEFALKQLDEDKKVVSFKRIVVELPFSLPIWGSHIGWLGWYILVSIPLTTTIRKLLGIVQ